MPSWHTGGIAKRLSHFHWLLIRFSILYFDDYVLPSKIAYLTRIEKKIGEVSHVHLSAGDKSLTCSGGAVPSDLTCKQPELLTQLSQATQSPERFLETIEYCSSARNKH